VKLPEALRADLDRYVRALEARFGADLVSIVLFGSWALDEGRTEGDIDLLVVIRGLVGGRFERYQLARQVSEELANRLSLIVSTPEGAEHLKPYYLGMLSRHLMLRDTGGFFAAILERLRRRLGEPGARRDVDEDGDEFWDLEPDWKPGNVVTL
jgi:predicted nucleotidyltransferase